jgi:hypothetical protein
MFYRSTAALTAVPNAEFAYFTGAMTKAADNRANSTHADDSVMQLAPTVVAIGELLFAPVDVTRLAVLARVFTENLDFWNRLETQCAVVDKERYSVAQRHEAELAVAVHRAAADWVARATAVHINWPYPVFEIVITVGTVGTPPTICRHGHEALSSKPLLLVRFQVPMNHVVVVGAGEPEVCHSFGPHAAAVYQIQTLCLDAITEVRCTPRPDNTGALPEQTHKLNHRPAASAFSGAHDTSALSDSASDSGTTVSFKSAADDETDATLLAVMSASARGDDPWNVGVSSMSIQLRLARLPTVVPLSLVDAVHPLAVVFIPVPRHAPVPTAAVAERWDAAPPEAHPRVLASRVLLPFDEWMPLSPVPPTGAALQRLPIVALYMALTRAVDTVAPLLLALATLAQNATAANVHAFEAGWNACMPPGPSGPLRLRDFTKRAGATVAMQWQCVSRLRFAETGNTTPTAQEFCQLLWAAADALRFHNNVCSRRTMVAFMLQRYRPLVGSPEELAEGPLDALRVPLILLDATTVEADIVHDTLPFAVDLVVAFLLADTAVAAWLCDLMGALYPGRRERITASGFTVRALFTAPRPPGPISVHPQTPGGVFGAHMYALRRLP